MKRSPLARKSGLKRPRTARKPRTGPEWTAVRVQVHGRARGRCDRCGTGLPLPAMHCHHRKPRSAGRDDTAANLLALCSDCHGHVHANPAESYRSGWVISRYDHREPAMVPVLLHATRWTLLAVTGHKVPLPGYVPLE